MPHDARMPNPSRAVLGSVAVAALTVELSSGGEALRVLPAGNFRARDGRPSDVPAWKLDAQSANKLIAKLHQRADALVIDYEHQTLHAASNGRDAPAAGWMPPKFEYRADGLHAASVEWTARAKAAIDAKEYRYFSPVFLYDKRTGEITDLLMGALTNSAGLDGLTDLSERVAARFSIQPHEDTTMTKEQLALLGLAENATDEHITAALTALKSRADAATTELAALKAQSPDPTKYVPIAAVTALQTEVAALKTAHTEREIDGLIQSAMDEGKVLPAMESWARELGKKDLAQLKAFIAAAQPIAALKSTQTRNKSPEGSPAGGPVTEAACKAEYEASAALREEFDTVGAYYGWRKTAAASTR